MAAATTKAVSALELKVGDIVHFYGARFEVKEKHVFFDNGVEVHANTSKWLDGEVVQGYFGPEKDWVFQGNHRSSFAVEC